MSNGWLVGLPVVVTLDDDGYVKIWVDITEAATAAGEAEPDPASYLQQDEIKRRIDAGRVKMEDF